MALFLSNFSNQNQAVSQNTEVPSQGRLSESALNQKIVEAIRNLIPGQTISAEIVSINGKEIQLALDANTILSARLEQNMNLSIGQILNFEVKSNSNNQVAIRPLFANLADDATLLKALDEARLPATKKNLEMAAALMEEGLPIDKKSLHSMYRQILANPQVAPSFLAQMSRLQIPFTLENIQQFSAYKNYEHQLVEGIKTVVEGLSEALSEVWSQKDGNEAVHALKNLIEAFTKEGVAKEGIARENIAGEGIAKEGIVLQKETAGIEGVSPDKSARSSEKEAGTENAVLLKEAAALMKPEGNAAQVPAKDSIAQFMTPKEREQLAALLEQAGVPADKEELAMIRSGNLTAKEVLQLALPLLENGMLKKEQIKELFTSKEFSLTLKEEVMRQWTLEPKEVTKEKSVEELYTRMREQAVRMLNALPGNGRDDSSLMKAATSLRENIDFMNQLNQLVTYAQLPLKLSNQKAHGDLYVYTNKQNLAKKDGNVSALLHLDLEYLGTIDIYVAMQNENVSTKFYLQKEEYLDFLEKNMYLLNERLAKKGYSVNSEVLLKENTTNVIEEMLESEKNHMVISQYTFDVRG